MFVVQIAGHVGKDPETRFTAAGLKVTSFSLAVNQRKGKEDVTIWVRVTVWGDRFDKMLSFLKKGSAVIITGRMNPPSSYTDKEGRTQFSLEVTAEMIDFSPFGKSDKGAEGSNNYSSNSREGGYSAENQHSNQRQPQAAAYAPQSGQAVSVDSFDDDDLPF